MQVKNSTSLNPNNITIFAIVKPNGYNYALCHTSQILGKLTEDPENGIYALRFGDFNNGGSCSMVPPDTTSELFSGFFGNNIPQGSTASTGLNSNVFVQKGEWYTLAFTYDGTIARLYINGAIVDSSKNTVSFTPSTYDLYIGATPNPSFHYYFNGVIDEIRIYNTAIAGEKIGYLNLLKNKYLKMGNKLVY